MLTSCLYRQLTSRIWACGITTTCGYVVWNRLISTKSSDTKPAALQTWDDLGSTVLIRNVPKTHTTICDTDGNATLIRTSTGTWSITYNGANRPVRFRNEETDTTVECVYDSQGRRYFKKVTVAGTDVVLRNYTYDALGRPPTRSTSRNGAMSPEFCR